MVSIAQVRAEGHYKLDEVFVKCEKAQHPRGCGCLLRVMVVNSGFHGGLGVGGHGLGVQGSDLENVDGDTTLIWRTVREISRRFGGT